MQTLEWFIAWRYLFSRERKALISLITLISMAGVAVGVSALIVVIGVMDGALKTYYQQMGDLYPHLIIGNADHSGQITITPVLMNTLRSRAEVRTAEPVIKRDVVVSGRGEESAKLGLTLYSYTPSSKGAVIRLPQAEADEAARLGPRQMLLGEPLLHQLRLQKGAPVSIITSAPSKAALYPSYKGTPMQVKDTFSTGFYAFDDGSAFLSLAGMRALFNMHEQAADCVYVKLKDPFQAEQVKKSLLHELGADYSITTWREINGDFFSSVQLQKIGMFIILSLITLVAAFNIIGTLILMVIQKTREIGILRAVGASRRLVSRIFLLDGVLIGMAGTLAGVGIGLTVCALIPVVKIPLPPMIYQFDHLPVTVEPLSVIAIVVSSMLICTLAALFPARQASRLNPVEALRYD